MFPILDNFIIGFIQATNSLKTELEVRKIEVFGSF